MTISATRQQLRSRAAKIKKIAAVQRGMYDAAHGDYMRGVANALIMASAIMEDTVPEYLPVPDKKRAPHHTEVRK